MKIITADQVGPLVKDGATLFLGGLAILALIVTRYGPLDTVLAGGFVLALVVAVEAWRRTFDKAAILANFHRVMRLNAAAATGLAGYVAWHLVAGS